MRAWRRRGILKWVGLGLSVGVLVWETWSGGEGIVNLIPLALAVILHELGHFVAARACGVSVRGLRPDVCGVRMQMDGLMSYGTEWLVAACGPLVNLVSAAVSFLWLWGRGVLWGGGLSCGSPPDNRVPTHPEGLLLFAAASLVLGVINLLPVGTLDGGRMLYCILARLGRPHVAATVLRITTTAALLLLWLLAGYALIRTGGMLALFVFALTLLLKED